MRADDLPRRVATRIVRGPRAQRAARFGTADYEALYCRWLRDGDSALDRADGEGFLLDRPMSRADSFGPDQPSIRVSARRFRPGRPRRSTSNSGSAAGGNLGRRTRSANTLSLRKSRISLNLWLRSRAKWLWNDDRFRFVLQTSQLRGLRPVCRQAPARTGTRLFTER
jgi:hypothetical protein